MIKRALRLKSGTYHVRASELACIHKRKLQMIKVDVRFLDETVQSFDLPKNANGCDLFERVIEHLDLVNCEYFGLQYEKRIHTSTVFTWLNMHKCVKKQLANSIDSKLLYFKVKFYATDPSDLQFEEFTRYQFYLQIRNDIFNERLVLPNSIACLLGSYIAQSELGDYSEQNQEINYLAKLKILPNQTEDFERKVAELHKLHKGQNPADAECNFLEHAKRLEMYGVELFSIKDSSMKAIQLGITAFGLLVFQNSIRINMFSWSKILKISYKKKQFFIQLKRENNEDFDMLLGFNLESYQEAKLLWKTCVEHHTFYRVPTPIVETKRIEMFWRKSKWFSFWNSVNANKEPTTSANRLNLIFCKRSSSSASKMPQQASTTSTLPIKNSNSSDLDLNLNSNFQMRKSLSPIPPKKSHRRYINKKKLVLNIPNCQNSSVVDQHPVQTACSPNFYKIHQENRISSTTENQPKQAWNDDGNATMSKRFSGIANNLNGNSALEGKSEEFSKPFSPILIGHGLSYVDDDPLNTPIDESTSIFSVSPAKVFSVRLKADSNGRFGFNVISSNANGKETFDDNNSLVQQQSPPLGGPKKSISISRIAPNTSADKCSPKLSEGDRILLINGFDVRNGVTQERVIEIIRTAMFQNDGVLELVIEPSANRSNCNVDIGSDGINNNNGHDDDTASFQYILEKNSNFIFDHIQNDSDNSNRISGCDRLNQSMLLLASGLSSGTTVRQFELLQKRHPNMNYSVALEYDNLAKNRYRDILPYDETRVVLNENPRGGDFINANHISIEIDATNWRTNKTAVESVNTKLTTATTTTTTTTNEALALKTTVHNRYIATQGPLQSTCDDFWQMVLENNVRLIVMLTTVIEKGRPKCHKYWPSFNETIQTPSMQIECETEDTETSENFICRTFVISDLMTSKKRLVQHIQYVTWPDHDVPDSSCAFLEFTQKMRSIRNEYPSSPVVVHCSAGIGRTGALILMETAICLIEANEPVYPLDIVQEMRRQRAMMIQNSSQYSFVCETIYTAFSQGLLKPLKRS